MKVSASDLKKNEFISFNSDIFQIQKIDHNFRGRGSANLKIKLKNVASGNTLEKTYKPDNTVEKIEVQSIQMQYLYTDSSTLTFMNQQSYEQFEVPADMVGDVVKFIKEGQEMYVIVHDGVAIAVRPPQAVRLKVTESEAAAKGNTATNARKPVTVETGAIVQVPIFIKKGETIVVNPETGEYVERST